MPRKRAETLATNASGLTLAQWIHAAAFAQGHGLGPGDFREAKRDWEADVDPAEWGRPRQPSKRRHATKKSPAQLQRDIDEVLAGSTVATTVSPKKSKRVRKTRDIYVVQGNYGYGDGWEDVTAEETRKEILDRLREYRDNEPGVPFRWRRKREKIEA